jgi:hypothetical protein
VGNFNCRYWPSDYPLATASKRGETIVARGRNSCRYTRTSLTKIPHVTEARAEIFQSAARASVGSARGPATEELVKLKVHKLRTAKQFFETLENATKAAFQELPEAARQVATIPSFGTITAAMFVAKIGDINRFPSNRHVVAYFGVYPVTQSSGVNKDGTPKAGKTMRMSPRGCDQVRKLLWNAAKNALLLSPRMNKFYREKTEEKRGDVSLGHCMKKLIHWACSVWRNNEPFDPNRDFEPEEVTAATADEGKENAAGLKQHKCCENISKVTAASNKLKDSVAPVNKQIADRSLESNKLVDFSYLKEQLSIEEVLRELGYFDDLKGRGDERRGPCPIHKSQKRNSRSFAANLKRNIFKCRSPDCNAAGNALELWMALTEQPLYEAAIDVAQTLDLDLQKRNTEMQEPVN